MADRSLVISWGEVVRGREERAYDNFNAVVTLYGRMQQEGRIERFDVTLLAPNGGPGGFMQLLGSAQQLASTVQAESQRWAEVIRKQNIKPE